MFLCYQDKVLVKVLDDEGKAREWCAEDSRRTYRWCPWKCA